jgi:FixJ family two-component response regulator
MVIKSGEARDKDGSGRAAEAAAEKAGGRPQVIVIVDDEEMVLKSIVSFLSLETDYVVKSFTSTGEALDYLRANDADLVVSDYLMPEMDGISFLSKVRELRPEVPRIILTGYADKENAIKAINEVGLFQYLEKPWDNRDLLMVFRNGLERQNLLRRLQEKMAEIERSYADLHRLQRDVLKAFI